jgi:hypothetical protein
MRGVQAIEVETLRNPEVKNKVETKVKTDGKQTS